MNEVGAIQYFSSSFLLGYGLNFLLFSVLDNLLVSLIMLFYVMHIVFNRPCVAGAVLQTV